jgi:signal transduction histidine kinase
MPWDALVGFAFVTTGLALRTAPPAMRVMWALVGATWWLGDIPLLRVLHQGVLVAALGCFPTGRPVTIAQRASVVVGVVVAPGILGQAGAAMGFLATAGIGLRRGGFGQLAAAAVGLWLAASVAWSKLWAETFDPTQALVVYELLLILVALTLPWGLWWEARRNAALSDRVLAMSPAGLSGLETALRRALGRRSLHLTRIEGDVVVEGLGSTDAATTAAVSRAVELTSDHERVLAEAGHRLVELELARARLLAAADLERERAARRLSDDLAALRACQARVAGLPEVAREVGAAAADVDRIVAGLHPDGLGGGGVGPAIRRLCARHPVPVSAEVDEHAAGDLAAETALFYACSEALANSAKHAGAHRVVVTLRAGDPMVLTIADDGVGGVDPGGAGLLSLQDRLATVGGDLTVVSEPGGSGTRLVARVPIEARPGAQSMRT